MIHYQCLSSQACTQLYSCTLVTTTPISQFAYKALTCMNRFIPRVCEPFTSQSFFWTDACCITQRRKPMPTPLSLSDSRTSPCQSSFYMHTRRPSMSLPVLGQELYLNLLETVYIDSCPTINPEVT